MSGLVEIVENSLLNPISLVFDKIYLLLASRHGAQSPALISCPNAR